MDDWIDPLFAATILIWATRQVYHRRLAAGAARSSLALRARRNRVPAWMLYPPYAGLLVFAASAWIQSGGADVPARMKAGLSVVLFGSAIVLVALVQLRRSYAEELELHADAPLVSSGLFAITNHPMRWGVLAEAVGLAFIAGTAPAAALLILLTGLIVRRNQDEDLMMAEAAQSERNGHHSPRSNA